MYRDIYTPKERRLYLPLLWGYIFISIGNRGLITPISKYIKVIRQRKTKNPRLLTCVSYGDY